MYREKNGWYYLIAILLIIIGTFIIWNPFSGTIALIWMIGLGLIVSAIAEWQVRRIIKLTTQKSTVGLVITAALNLILGIMVIVQPTIGLLALPFIGAFWMISDSLSYIFLNYYFDKLTGRSSGWVYFFGILGTIMGVFMLFNPESTLIAINTLLGIYLIIHGIRLFTHN